MTSNVKQMYYTACVAMWLQHVTKERRSAQRQAPVPTTYANALDSEGYKISPKLQDKGPSRERTWTKESRPPPS